MTVWDEHYAGRHGTDGYGCPECGHGTAEITFDTYFTPFGADSADSLERVRCATFTTDISEHEHEGSYLSLYIDADWGRDRVAVAVREWMTYGSNTGVPWPFVDSNGNEIGRERSPDIFSTSDAEIERVIDELWENREAIEYRCSYCEALVIELEW